MGLEQEGRDLVIFILSRWDLPWLLKAGQKRKYNEKCAERIIHLPHLFSAFGKQDTIRKRLCVTLFVFLTGQ
jgi:hypothetical protein